MESKRRDRVILFGVLAMLTAIPLVAIAGILDVTHLAVLAVPILAGVAIGIFLVGALFALGGLWVAAWKSL